MERHGMRLERLKNAIGFTLVILHLVAIALCYAWLRSRLDATSFQVTILIITPITALYALAFLRDVVRNMFVNDPIDVRLVRGNFAFLAILFTLAFSGFVIYTIWAYAFGQTGQTADDLKLSLASVETALGAFMGLITETLFGRLPSNNRNPTAPQDGQA